MTSNRRKSVFDPTIDPTDDADAPPEFVVHPKNDEQRSLLLESVKNILLFRELDSEAVSRDRKQNALHCLIVVYSVQ